MFQSLSVNRYDTMKLSRTLSEKLVNESVRSFGHREMTSDLTRKNQFLIGLKRIPVKIHRILTSNGESIQ